MEVELPREQSQWILANTIDVEAASIFDEMLRAGETEGWNTWPGTFREAQFISAIDYFRIQRRRRQLQRKFDEMFQGIDFLVNCSDLLITNLTGHPSVVMPISYRKSNGFKEPVSALITGHLNHDDRLLAFGRAFQQQVTAHLERPPLDELIERKAKDEKKESESKKKEAGEKDGQVNRRI